jgi:5-formyltetrahydrofolate cyclo-ligase
VASYQPIAGEPDLTEFNSWLQAMGKTLVLPRVIGENLEFATGDLVQGKFAILEPTGPSISLSDCDLILVPALAVDLLGVRLGKGKGFYDRALSAVRGVPKYAVVFDCEVLPELPKQDHDQPVTGAVTPSAIRHFQASTKG